MQGFWLSILEYAQYRKVSISTVRRYVKSNRVQHKKENGKFFIFVSNDNYEKRMSLKEDKTSLETKKLKNQIKQLREENAELKMLVTIYENQKRNNELPEIPFS